MINVTKLVKYILLRQLHGIRNDLLGLKDKNIKYRRFHSQFGEDKYIYENIDLPEQGVFVDVGSGHPTYLSNTYFSEKNGWTGICIDADPRQVESSTKKRAIVVWAAISPVEGQVELDRAFSPTYSTSSRKYKYNKLVRVQFRDTILVPSYRLETLLEKYNIGI
ncbi:MAG: hypothetical protein WBD99_15285 [Thermodesulfobacteriota bacterium]